MKLSLVNRIVITCIVLVFIALTLVWEHFNGGVQTHYFLQDDTLPGISNYWGLLVGAILTWVTLYRIQFRVKQLPEIEKKNSLKKARWLYLQFKPKKL